MFNVIEEWLLSQGLAPNAASLTVSATGIVSVLLLAWVADLVAKRVLH